MECRADASCIIASPLPPACEWSWNPPRERAPAIRRSVSISEAIHSHSDAVAYHQSNSWGITDVNAGGDSSQAWGDVLSESAATKVDAQSGLSAVMAVKDATELENTRRAANLTAAVLKVKKMPTGLLGFRVGDITRPFLRRPPISLHTSVAPGTGATRTPRKCGMRPSFKGHFLSPPCQTL